MQYRVRLLKHPVLIYNGPSFERAALYLDEYEAMDRVLEVRACDGWHIVISVEMGTC